ncbi:MAG: hypothetical protein ACRDX9_07160 [Acidimicrobiia bacterium]
MKRLTLCLVLALVIGSCADPDTGATTSAAPTTVDTTPATEPATTPTTAPTTLPPTTVTTVAPTTTALPPFPPGRETLEHGGDAWVVVLAGSADENDPVLAGATQAAEDAGYVTGPTDCDEGADAALGMPDGTKTVSVYLETEADAQAALLAFEARGVSGVVALVQTFCLD